ncbi:MAG: hypothetical protein V1913_13140 [Fibrobacterota bacterium]
MELIIGVIFLVVLVVLALYIGLQKKEVVADEAMPMIHTSGIYSVIRKSPRENLHPAKPVIDDLRAFVSVQTEDIHGAPLSGADKVAALTHYQERLDAAIQLILTSDREGVQRYLVVPCAGEGPCDAFRQKSFFITREDIYHHPELIPPFYPGCGCSLRPEADKMLSGDTEHFRIGQDDERFRLPSWKHIKKVNG